MCIIAVDHIGCNNNKKKKIRTFHLRSICFSHSFWISGWDGMGREGGGGGGGDLLLVDGAHNAGAKCIY